MATLEWDKQGRAKLDLNAVGFSSSFEGLRAYLYGDDPPPADQEELRELLGLDPDEEVVSYAVRLPDGTIDVRVLEE